MKETRTINTISWLAAALVIILALMAFILSYSSLQHLAHSNGVGERLSYLWPLLLDFAMIVFSLAILRANLRRERAIYPWLLTIAFAGMATIANVLDVATLGLPPLMIAASVKALAPVSLVLAFELLMSMIRAEINRAAVVQGIADLRRQWEQMTVDYQQDQAVYDANREQATAEIKRLDARLSELKSELTAIKSEKRRAYTEITDETRAAAGAILAERSGISGAELGRMLNRSPSTGRRLKRELLPEIAINGNGHHLEEGE